jgi:serine/threonine protein phosphatase PrpC
MEPSMSTCPSCSTTVTEHERFCEACGADLTATMATRPDGTAPDATAPDGTAPDGTTTGGAVTGGRDPVAGTSAAAADEASVDPAPSDPACAACGGQVADDGWCGTCGTKAADPRDHVVEQPASWVAAVCDRGIRHPRNEDAVAVAADPEPGTRAVLVVCDGVSSSTDSDVASLAGARAARDVLTASHPRGLGSASTRVGLLTATLAKATDAANAAVLAATAEGSPSPASCTLVAAVLDGSLLVAGWVGDSRAYWLPDEGPASALTVDDSFAAEQVAHGVPRHEAENGPHAHAITRWLGLDAPDHTPRTVSRELDTPGWVLVCSDGLWNYCSEAGDLAALVRQTAQGSGAQPSALAEALVDWANAQGGRDNITVALARFDPA